MSIAKELEKHKLCIKRIQRLKRMFLLDVSNEIKRENLTPDLVASITGVILTDLCKAVATLNMPVFHVELEESLNILLASIYQGIIVKEDRKNDNNQIA